MTIDFALPSDLPRPEDDGACDHLPGLDLPAVTLLSTSGREIDLSQLSDPRTVIYAYPRTGVPGKPSPEGWDAIPGARGCTPQSCGFRDHFKELASLNTAVFGLSTQTSEFQSELVDRLHLPFEILSDAELKLTNTLRLPTFTIDEMTLIKRLTLIVRDSMIEHVLYPVFPSNESAHRTIQWLREHPLR